ncbi:MAG: ribonuclease III [Fidelibacterota bacterium]
MQLIRQFLSRISSNHTELNELQRELNYFFRKREYLVQAVTHKSISSEPRKNYERLEFLGDAIIDHIISKKLIKEFPFGDEGLLTQKRSALVQKSFLAKTGERLNLLKYLAVRGSVDLTQKKVSENQLANVFESIIGAIYLDGGISPCKKIIDRTLWQYRSKAWESVNYKGRLIEKCHSHQLKPPRFVVESTRGPEHRKTFQVAVIIGSKRYSPGIADNKKTAEQEAARLALESLAYTD